MPFDPRTIDEHPDIIVIDGAIDALRRYGWVQESSGNEQSGFCLLGAIAYSRRRLGDGTPNPLGTHGSVTRALLRRRAVLVGYGAPYEQVPDFNDAPTTTKRRALNFLRAFRNAVAKKLLIGK